MSLSDKAALHPRRDDVPGLSTAPLAASPPARERQASEHFVQFYETDSFLVDAVSTFLKPGLDAGDACIVIATQPHRLLLEQRLQHNGQDLAAAQERGEYIALDAAETLAQIMVDGWPAPERFREIVGGLIARAAQNGRHARIFGEMVMVLWAEGKHAAAMRLEELWNEVQHTTPSFALFCAYAIDSFAGETYRVPFMQICQQHTQVIPTEDFTAQASRDERLRAITLLQQKAAWLEAEIAERKRAEERLRLSENRYRRLFESAIDGILLVDPRSGAIIDANPAMTALLGYSHEQLLRQELWHIGLFADRQAMLAAMRELQQQQVLRREPVLLRASDGRRRYVELVSTLYQTNGHQTIQCTLRDITDRKQAEEALRASEERFRTLANQAPIMIWQSDAAGATTYINSAWSRFTGLSTEESLGDGWLGALHPEDRAPTLICWREALATRTPYQTESRLRRADGSYAYISVYGSICTDSEGAFTGYIGTLLDMTEQKELETQREAFISMVTHELRTPLTGLQGNIQLAQRRLSQLLSKEEEIPSEQQQTLEAVLAMLSRSRQQLQVQHRLINDLVDISSIQEDKLELRLAPCDLAGLVYATVQDYQTAQPARLITLDLPEQAPLQVYGDQDRIQQVLSNYLTNALKFSPATEPIEVGLAPQAGQVRVWVKDHGPGLTREAQEHIWQRFYQSPHTPVQSGSKVGLGLGLYICQQLMRRQQGQVGVESTPGHGATFWFTLPPLSPQEEPD